MKFNIQDSAKEQIDKLLGLASGTIDSSKSLVVASIPNSCTRNLTQNHSHTSPSCVQI